MRQFSFTSVLLACTAFVAHPAAAQVPTPDQDAAADAAANTRSADDDVIVVSAARTVLPVSALPLTVDVIDSESLAEQVAISGSVVDAVANLTPSFSPTRQKLSGSGETLRGRSPLYAINGIPQSTPIRDGSRDGYTIDPFFIDRVELIFGSNALQGIGGTGGVINQVTVGAPAEDGVSGRALLQGTAADGLKDDGFGGKVAALVGYRSGAFDATVGAAYESRGAFYDGAGRRIAPDGTQGDVQDSKSWSVFGRFGWQLDDSARIELIANRFELEGDGDYVAVEGDRDADIPSSAVRGDQPGIPPSNRAEMLSLSLTDDDLFGGTLTTQLFFNRTRDIFGGGAFPTFQDVRIAPDGTLFDQSANRSRKYGGKFSYERPFGEVVTATIGFDALYDRTAQSLALTGRDWVPPTDFRSLAPFGQLNLKLLDGLVRLAGGARWENVKLTVDDYETLASYGSRRVAGGTPSFDDVLLNGGAILEPMDGLRLYGSYAEGYTMADVGRILRAVNEPGVDIDNYLNISPVVSNNREIGAELDRGPFTASAAWFWSSSDFGALLVDNGGVFDVRRQRIEIEGIELNLAWRTPLPGLTLSAGYADLSGKTDSDQDGEVDRDLDGANIAPDRLNLAAAYQQGPFSGRLQVQNFLSRGFAGVDDDLDFSGYTITDAYVRYETGFGGLTLAVQNLTDEQYISYNSETTTGTDIDYFAGRGRTFTLGWDYRF